MFTSSLYSFLPSFLPFFIDSFVHSFIHLFVRSFIRSFIHCQSPFPSGTEQGFDGGSGDDIGAGDEERHAARQPLWEHGYDTQSDLYTFVALSLATRKQVRQKDTVGARL